MHKIIGIRGHRGAGKESVAFLLASTLEFIKYSESLQLLPPEKYLEGFNNMYDEAVKKLVDNKDKAFTNINFNYVYLDAFGDAPKAMVQQLLGCDHKYLWNEYWKDHAVVNIQTFEIREVNQLPNDLISLEDISDGTPIGEMSLRDFILYFGQNIMQKYFGRDVWVKSTAMNDRMNEEYFEDGIRIYTDVKAPTELSYLINKQAIIINVERKGHEKKGGLDLLKNDNRWNYNLKIKDDDLMSIKNDILKIAEDIYYGKNN